MSGGSFLGPLHMLTGLLLTACPLHFRNREAGLVRLWFPPVNCSRTWVFCMLAYCGAHISSTSPFLTLVTTEPMTHRVGFLKIINWCLSSRFRGQNAEPVAPHLYQHLWPTVFVLESLKQKTTKHPQSRVAVAQKLKQLNSLVWLSLRGSASEFLKVLLPHQLWVVMSTFQFL